MKLTQSTWQEIDSYLASSDGIIIPTGSTEQHGPMGLLGTDMLCADAISVEAGKQANALVARAGRIQYGIFRNNLYFPRNVSQPV